MQVPSWLRIEQSWRLVAAACAVTAFVAGVAASGSYQHQYEQAIRYGQAPGDAGLFPWSVDGLIVAATLAVWAAARKHASFWRTVPAWLVLIAGIAGTIIINLSPDYPSWGVWLRPGISAWPAVAFVAAYELTVWLVRMASETPAAAEAPPGPRAPPPAGGGRPGPGPAAGSAREQEPASPGPGAPRRVQRRPAGRKPRGRAGAIPEWRKLPPEELARRVAAAGGRNELARDLGCSRQAARPLLREHVNGHAPEVSRA